MTMEDIRALEEETKKELDEERSKVSLPLLVYSELSSGTINIKSCTWESFPWRPVQSVSVESTKLFYFD